AIDSEPNWTARSEPLGSACTVQTPQSSRLLRRLCHQDSSAEHLHQYKAPWLPRARAATTTRSASNLDDRADSRAAGALRAGRASDPGGLLEGAAQAVRAR